MSCKSINVKPIQGEDANEARFLCELNQGARAAPGIECVVNEDEFESTYYEFALGSIYS